jgi:putative membrane protein insertion efficiency factor
MKTVCLAILAAYRFCVSPWLGPACRFEPTCSAYASQAIQQFGVLKGCGMALWRLLKCHPFHPGGYDPITGDCRMRHGE